MASCYLFPPVVSIKDPGGAGAPAVWRSSQMGRGPAGTVNNNTLFGKTAVKGALSAGVAVPRRKRFALLRFAPSTCMRSRLFLRDLPPTDAMRRIFAFIRLWGNFLCVDLLVRRMHPAS